MTKATVPSEDPRAKAYELLRAKETCDREGHLRPWKVWYDRNGDGPHPCLRGCGENVAPQIDWSGHP
jgi:hypothetical protein